MYFSAVVNLMHSSRGKFGGTQIIFYPFYRAKTSDNIFCCWHLTKLSKKTLIHLEIKQALKPCCWFVVKTGLKCDKNSTNWLTKFCMFFSTGNWPLGTDQSYKMKVQIKVIKVKHKSRQFICGFNTLLKKWLQTRQIFSQSGPMLTQPISVHRVAYCIFYHLHSSV